MIRHFDYRPSQNHESSHQWLVGGYDLEIGHFLEVAGMVATWWIVAFLLTGMLQSLLSHCSDLLSSNFYNTTLAGVLYSHKFATSIYSCINADHEIN